MENGELSLILNWIIKYATGMRDEPLAVYITLKKPQDLNISPNPSKIQKHEISANQCSELIQLMLLGELS